MSTCKNNKYPQYSKIFGYNCSQQSKYFLGATRTYNYISFLKNPSSKKDPWKTWHHGSPSILDLKKIDTRKPYRTIYTVKNGPRYVDSYCLDTNAKYNLFAHKFVLTPPDQVKIGRYTKLIQDYHQSFSTDLINEYNNLLVKWREVAWWLYIQTPLSISFWIGGCGDPCYLCGYKIPYPGHSCVGAAEGTLKTVLIALDKYWLDKANAGELWPDKESLLVDYYGVVSRGPEPTIGWFWYLQFKKEVCSYCHCISFCFLVQCIDPWFIRHSAATSIMTFNTYSIDDLNSIPQKKPGNFIEFAQNVNGTAQFEQYGIEFDHLAQEEVYIKGVVSFHDGKIYEDPSAKQKSYTLSQIMSNTNLPGSQIQSFSQTQNGYQYAGKTTSSGFHSLKNGEQITTVDSVFFFYGISGQASDNGTIIRNLAIKYHDHNVRKEVFDYNWLYVDIPNRIPMNVTPAVTSFDAGQDPDIYWEDLDPLVIMNKDVYFKSVLQQGGPPALNGIGQQRMRFSTRENLFNEGGNNIPINERYYPFVWTDRALFKTIKAPYNLYFKSGDTAFKECALGDILNLPPGRYYFPNPYACALSAGSIKPYDNAGASVYAETAVYDVANHAKYFETSLPSQFIVNGQLSLTSRLNVAKEMLSDPQVSPNLIMPIDEFPRLKLSGVNGMAILDWEDTSLPFYKNWKHSAWNPISILDLEKKKFLADFKNYNQSWHPV